MLWVIVICTVIIHKYYSTYLFGVKLNIFINIHRGVKKHGMIRYIVRGMDYFDLEDLKGFLGSHADGSDTGEGGGGHFSRVLSFR